MAQLGLERWKPVEINRSQLTEAPYNPRLIDAESKRRLKKVLAKHGLVMPIVWNRRTGRIVAGHQRVAIMDALAKSHSYTMTVAEIDVSESEERELNIATNNDAAMGVFDLDKLSELMKSTEIPIDAEGAGWSVADTIRLFGQSAVVDESDALEVAERMRAVTDEIKGNLSKTKDKYDIRYTVIVFRDSDEESAFHSAVGWDDNDYQSCDAIAEALGLDLSEESSSESESQS